MAKTPPKKIDDWDWMDEKDEYGYTYSETERPGYMNPTKQDDELTEEQLKEVMKRAKGGYEDPAGGDLPEETEVALEETIDTPEDSFKADFDERASMKAGLRETKAIMGKDHEGFKEVDVAAEKNIKALMKKASGAKGKKRSDGYADVWKALEEYDGKDTSFIEVLRDKFSKKASVTKDKKYLGDYVTYFNNDYSWKASRPGRTTAAPTSFENKTPYKQSAIVQNNKAKFLKDGYYINGEAERPTVHLNGDSWRISENHMAKGSPHAVKKKSQGFELILVNGKVKKFPEKKWNLGWDMYRTNGSLDAPAFLEGTITQIDSPDENGRYPTFWGRSVETKTNVKVPVDGRPRTLYLRYGHLTEDSADDLAVGGRVTSGQTIGTIGKTTRNGPSATMRKHLDVRGYVYIEDENGNLKQVQVSPQDFMPLSESPGAFSGHPSEGQNPRSFKHGGEVKKYWEGGPALTAESGGSSAYDEEYLMSLSSDEIIDWRNKNATILSDVQRTEVNEIIGNKKRREQNPENYIDDRPTGAADTGEYGEFYTQERTTQPGEEPGEWGELEKVKDPPNNMTVSEGVDLEWSDPSKEKGSKFKGKGAEADWSPEPPKKKEDDFVPGKTQAELDHEQAQTAAKKEAAFLQQQRDLIQQEVKKYVEERDELVKIDPDRFWKNKGTVSKIAAILGSAAGAWISGRYGGPNKWQQMIEKEIDRDINAQKLDNEARAKKKSAALKRVEMLMKNYRFMTKNKEAQANLDHLLAKTKNVRVKHDIKTQKENQSSKDAIKMRSGLTDDELARYDARYPKQNIRKRAVKSTKTGLWYIFNDYDQKKKAMVSLVEGEKAINNIKDLKELVKEIGIGTVVPEAFHGFDADLRRVKVLRESLKGALRLEIFGPGVMTDTERAIAEQVIGDPTKFWTTDAAELEMLETLQQKINYGIRQQLIRSGIHLPPSQNEAVINQYLKSKGWSNTDNNRAKTVTALIKLEKKHGTGTYWRPDEDLPL